MNTRVLALALASVFIGGCATASLTYGPDGRQAVSIECAGGVRSWAACLQEAGNICGQRGYDVYSQDSAEGTAVLPVAGGLFAGPVGRRHLLIACKGEGEVRLPELAPSAYQSSPTYHPSLQGSSYGVYPSQPCDGRDCTRAAPAR